MNVQDNPHLLVAMGARNLGSTVLSIFVQENLSMINCCDISTYNIQDSYFGMNAMLAIYCQGGVVRVYTEGELSTEELFGHI